MPGQRLALTRYLQRRRWHRRGLGLLIVVTLVLLALADRRGLLLYDGGDIGRYHGKWFAVVQVVDGDTLDIDAPDGEQAFTRVRFWGIDAPEMGRPWLDTPAEPGAQQAADRLASLCDGQQVRLWLQPHRLRGAYGRLLAYVELPDGQIANEVLLAEGLVRADDRWPHRDQERYSLLERQARHDSAGMWSR